MKVGKLVSMYGNPFSMYGNSVSMYGNKVSKKHKIYKKSDV